MDIKNKKKDAAKNAERRSIIAQVRPPSTASTPAPTNPQAAAPGPAPDEIDQTYAPEATGPAPDTGELPTPEEEQAALEQTAAATADKRKRRPIKNNDDQEEDEDDTPNKPAPILGGY